MLKHKDRGAMNLNDFVVLPNSAAKSVKLNARNLQELKTQTGSLAQESEEMEEKLKQLRMRMSKEKEERVYFRMFATIPLSFQIMVRNIFDKLLPHLLQLPSGDFRWRSGQYGHSNNTTSLINTRKNKDIRLQKLSAGKVKIRVLKDEPPTAQPPSPSPAAVNLRTNKKNKLKGTVCGQCEVRTAGVKCAECSEDYCIGCFSKFHQKGALKFHTIIPTQTELQTHVITRDVVSCLQTQANPSCYPATFSSSNPRPNSERNHAALSDPFGDQRAENAGVAQHMQMQNHFSQILVCHDKTNFSEPNEKEPSLLTGAYDEEESAKSFQEALQQWREADETTSKQTMWTPFRPATVADVPTQTDLLPGGGGAGRREPVMVEFSQPNLSLLDRLLLKKHRRTPIELPPLLSPPCVKSLPETHAKEPEISLTAEEEEFHQYFSSLFAVPTNIQGPGRHNSAPDVSLTIEVLDEENMAVNAEKRSIVNRIVPSHQHKPSKQTAGQTAPSPTQPLICSAVSSKPESFARPTTETPGSGISSSKTANSKSKKPTQTGHKAKAGHSSPQSPLLSSSAPLYRSRTAKSSFSFSPNDSTSASLRSGEEHHCDPNISPALRSTFTLTPSTSVDSALLPKISLQQSPGSKSPKHSLLDLDSQSFMSPSPSTIMSSISSGRNSVKSVRKSPSLSMSQDVFSRSRLSHDGTHGDAAVFLASEHVTTCRESMSEEHGNQFLSDAAVNENDENGEAMSGCAKESTFALIQEYHNALKSIQDSEDEMSSDSLGLALCEEDSEDEDVYVDGCSESGRSRDDRGNPASAHLDDAFVPAHGEGERDLWSDEAEQLSQPALIMDSHSSGSELDNHSDSDEFLESHVNPISNLQNFDALHLSSPTDLASFLRPLSQAAQEILDICGMDQSGCEDPDLEADTTQHTLSRLERELRQLAKETGPEVFTVATGNSRTENPCGNRHFTRSRMSKEEQEEEEAVQNDQQSVLLLP